MRCMTCLVVQLDARPFVEMTNLWSNNGVIVKKETERKKRTSKVSAAEVANELNSIINKAIAVKKNFDCLQLNY